LHWMWPFKLGSSKNCSIWVSMENIDHFPSFCWKRSTKAKVLL
jgi:hypothetical protein